MSVRKAVGTEREKRDVVRSNKLPFGKREIIQSVSFIESISVGTIRAGSGQAPETVSADCCGPSCPLRGLGEGWWAVLMEDAKLLALLPLSWLL